jgi:hypothetical protein
VPPQLRFEVNMTEKFCSNSFNEAGFSNTETISRIVSTKNVIPAMHLNPEYWNRKLLGSAIQFMWFEIPPKEIVKSMMDERRERQDGYYYCESVALRIGY